MYNLCDALTSEGGQFDNCYRKKQIDVSFSCVGPVIHSEFRQHCQSSLQIRSAIVSWIHSYFDNVRTKFIIDNRTDALKTDVTLLNRICLAWSVLLSTPTRVITGPNAVDPLRLVGSQHVDH